MRVGLYARVSTRDKEQNVDVQLDKMRTYCAVRGFTEITEYVDEASADDLRNRTAFARMLKDASRRRIDCVIVFRLDRLARSVTQASTLLGQLRAHGVGLKSLNEEYIDTTTPFGEAVYYISMAFAGLEKALIQERVIAGMDYAKRRGTKSGKPIGRPKLDIPFNKVCEAYGAAANVYAAAARTLTTEFKRPVSAGYVYNRIKRGC